MGIHAQSMGQYLQCYCHYQGCTRTWHGPVVRRAGGLVRRSVRQDSPNREKSPEERIREILASRQGPHIITSKTRQALHVPTDIREGAGTGNFKRRVIVGEQKFRNFLKTGFVSVKAKSGLVYQIFPGHGVTAVYDQGQMVDRLCVVLTGNFPPTDSLIMRYIMILNNEQQFRGLAIKHGVTQRQIAVPNQVDMRPLPQI